MENSERSLMMVLRLSTMVVLLIGMIVLGVAKGDIVFQYGNYSETLKLRFSQFKAFRYVMSGAVIGFAYSLVLTIIGMLPARNSIPDSYIFLGDLMVSYLLMSAGSAGVAVIMQEKEDIGLVFETDEIGGALKLLRFVSASVSMVFLAFALLAMSALISSKNDRVSQTVQSTTTTPIPQIQMQNGDKQLVLSSPSSISVQS